jgi:hypothetical protein
MTLELSPTSLISQLLRQQRAGEQPSRADDRPRIRLDKGESCIVEDVVTDTKRGENQNTLIAEIGDGTDAINFLLVAAGCPANLRPLIDCLIGLAGDRVDWFEAADEVVGTRARAGDGEMSRDAAKKWVQRWRKALIEWQTFKNLALIECSPGGQDRDGTRYPSRYKVNLLWLAAATVEKARSSDFWRNNPSRALAVAADEIIEDTPETDPYKPRFRKPKRNDDALLERNPKTALTLLTEVARIMRERGEDVAEWWETFTQQGAARVLTSHTEDKQSVHTKDQEAVDKIIHRDNGVTGGAVVTARPSENAGTSQSDGKVRSFGHLPDNEALIDEIKRATAEAYDALDAFVSVGATSFLVTMKDEATHEARSKKVSLREMPQAITERIEQNSHAEESLILRPNGASLIQVDDCTAAERELLAPFAFLVAETSPENFQAWIALPEETSEDERKRIRERLFKGALLNSPANVGAGNAMRWIGSRNCKRERRGADGSFPRVKLIQSSFARFVTEPELQDAGLLAPDVPPCDSPLPPAPEKRPMDKIVHRVHAPNYEKCLQSVAKKKNGKPDRSAADLLFAVTCLNWKLAFDETVALLKRASAKARVRRDDYAERTVKLALSRVAI